MITVASKELKNRLGRYLAVVRTGEHVQVTDRGKLVACLVPAGEDLPQAARVLARVAAKGAVRVGTGRMPRRRKGATLRPGRTVSEMVAEQRR
ncbi:MAG: type II toxin-antitoxin system prevent-host-death family antitoxin [Acidobacteria bacterium]|nr:type II toxin-antitoxin system prevent-host-death family antitoxin [Acidobacteriota bacterium]